jgi:hypothetical protein
MDQDQKHQVYWQAQLDALLKLKLLGVNLDLRHRVEPMKMLRFLNKLWNSKEAGSPEARDLLKEAEAAIATLVYLRTKGAEPPHSNGRYL